VAVALVALDARIVTTKRTLTAEKFFTASVNSSTVLEPDELIKEILVPAPPAGVKQTYRKFTLREPVDFAIVSVASVLTLSDGVCKDARIVLGAVAPAPTRLRGAEEQIKGRPVTDKEAAEIAKQALANARPLAKNEYKVEIAKALVKQAIVG
jgi:xanthine dehydrogenase YagS FAD-binding subunit